MLARVLLSAAALLPYWRLLTFGAIFVPDDGFTSDIFSGELPARVLAARLIRSHQWPVWTSGLCSGIPMAGAPADPLTIATFSLLPTAAALDLFLIVTLLVAAHGAYGLGRRFGADRVSAVLAGTAFAASGYFACQLRHLAIVSTVAWLPAGMLLIDRALDPAPASNSRRMACAAALGLVFAQQTLCGFPQSAYLCALAYGAFALFRGIELRRHSEGYSLPLRVLAGLTVAMVLGAAAGAVVLLPLSKLADISDRTQLSGWDWATIPVYWRQSILSFLVPYVNGDVSNGTYIGHPAFWEDYGYVGAATFLLALYGAFRERRRSIVAFLTLMTIVAYYFVLGRSTPVYRAAYLLLPGLKAFRFPTRFLILVELGLALLAAIGLTRLRQDLERRGVSARAALIAVQLICAATAIDLWFHQSRQNPFVPAGEWLAPPATVGLIRTTRDEVRTFTPNHRQLHGAAFKEARGWSNVEPYYRLRDVLEPNIGAGYWDVPSADCYSGVSAAWYVDVWGTIVHEHALVAPLAVADPETRQLRVRPGAAQLLGSYGVTLLLSPYPATGAPLTLAGRSGSAYVYRIDGAARARFVADAIRAATEQEALARVADPAFDATREIVLLEAPPGAVSRDVSIPSAPGRARITFEDSRSVIVEAEAPADGYLLLADTYSPGWTARVDGSPAPIYRANVSVRAVPIARGRHEIEFSYDPPGFFPGLGISIGAWCVLAAWLAATRFIRRSASATARTTQRSRPAR